MPEEGFVPHYRYEPSQVPWHPPETVTDFPDLLSAWEATAGNLLRRVARLCNGLYLSSSVPAALSELVVFHGSIEQGDRPSQRVLEELAAPPRKRVCSAFGQSIAAALWDLNHDLRQRLNSYSGFMDFYALVRDIVPKGLCLGDQACYYVLETALSDRELSDHDRWGIGPEWSAVFQRLKAMPELHSAAGAIPTGAICAHLRRRLKGFNELEVAEDLKSDFLSVTKARREQRTKTANVPFQWISATKAAELSVELRRAKSLSWIVKLCKKHPAPFACQKAPAESEHNWEIERHSFIDYLLTLSAQEEQMQPADKATGKKKDEETIYDRYAKERQRKEARRDLAD
jgi:hypothetical protein